jgi:hypothetical protein
VCTRFLEQHEGLRGRTLGHLKAWVELDPSADEPLEKLLLAYRRQLVRAYVRGD